MVLFLIWILLGWRSARYARIRRGRRRVYLHPLEILFEGTRRHSRGALSRTDRRCRLGVWRSIFGGGHTGPLVNRWGPMWLGPRLFCRCPWSLHWLLISWLLSGILFRSPLRCYTLSLQPCQCRSTCNAGGSISGLDIGSRLLTGADYRRLRRRRRSALGAGGRDRRSRADSINGVIRGCQVLCSSWMLGVGCGCLTRWLTLLAVICLDGCILLGGIGRH